MPYSSVAEAQNYHPAASGASQLAKAEDVLADAADLVAKYAPYPGNPEPDPVTSDYTSRAARCERRIFAALWDTGGGYISGTSISGATSDSFSGMAGVMEMVRSVMGPFFVDPDAPEPSSSNSSFTMSVASSFPPAEIDILPRA